MLIRLLNVWADDNGELRRARTPAGTATASEAPTKKAKNQPVKSPFPEALPHCLFGSTYGRGGPLCRI